MRPPATETTLNHTLPLLFPTLPLFGIQDSLKSTALSWALHLALLDGGLAEGAGFILDLLLSIRSSWKFFTVSRLERDSAIFSYYALFTSKLLQAPQTQPVQN